MSIVNFVYRLSEKGRRAAVLAGLPAGEYQKVEIPVGSVPAAFAECIYVEDNGQAWLSAVRDTGASKTSCPSRAQVLALPQGYSEFVSEVYPDLDAPITDIPAWLTDLAGRLPDLKATAQKAYAEKEAASIAQAAKDAEDYLQSAGESLAKLEALSDKSLSARFSEKHTGGPITDSTFYGDGYCVPDALKPRMATLRQRVEEYRGRIEQEKRSSMRAWIELNGSNRLRNCLREGIKCDGLYYTERLTAEYPGWERYDKIEGKCSDPINPPEEAFALLEEARKQIPEAKLQYYVDDGIRLYCALAEWPTHPEEIDLVYFGDQEWELQPDEQD